ncbi:MAG: GtrA family protein [Atopobiaceae bacterium]|jgi:dolichol-phosphate mannosyltransferase|nr:GtrA family protein [Atopobiaceae bacterium]MCH4180674.1 GtrA family protein [Atopobiaceae bacterium]MCH4214691.1 GtrA family protein [Atopobiaceae bacterium]MCH4229903.1 GtrA family protein [Atopobiaceae bacterium]MCH4276737.1 GtrA family protein [Atopobiaceae bacterium]
MQVGGHTISRRFLRFAASSITCTAVDQGLAWLLFAVLQPLMPGMDYQRILIGTYVARAASITINYNLNRHLVFDRSGGRRHAAARYLALAALVALLSSLGVYLCSTGLGMDERVAKLLVDFCLFFLNYNVQRTWVFGRDERDQAPEG